MSLYYRLEGNRQAEAGGALPGSALGNQSLKERIHRRIIEEAASNKLFLPGGFSYFIRQIDTILVTETIDMNLLLPCS